MKYYKLLSLALFVLTSLLFAQVSNDALIAHYKFDGNALDSSPNGLHGSVDGATSTSDRFGNPNKAFYFDGVNDYINLGNNQLLKPHPPITISGWFYYYEYPAPYFITDFHPTNYYGLVINTTWNNNTQIAINDGGSIGPDSRQSNYTDIPQSNSWFHFTCTIDENLVSKIFINGDEVSTSSSGFGNGLKYSNGYSYFGLLDSDTNGPEHFLHGKIDDFRMYNRILSDSEILELYSEDDSQDDLIAHYEFNGNALDSSPNNLDGIVHGATLTEDRFGVPERAYSFDGINDYIDLGNNYKLKPQPPFTIALWANYAGGIAGFFSNDINDQHYFGTRLYINNYDDIAFEIGNGGIIGPNSRLGAYTNSPGSNQWFHIAATLDISYNFTIFINGEEVTSSIQGNGDRLEYSSEKAVFGMIDSDVNGDPYYLDGKIDDFIMYNRILTNEEIAALAGETQEIKPYELTIENVLTETTEIVNVPVKLIIPENEQFSSFEFSIDGLNNYTEFLNIDRSQSDLLSFDWQISSNVDNGTLYIAGASSGLGAVKTGEGKLFDLVFSVNSQLSSVIIPLNFRTAIIDDSSVPVITNDGSIQVFNGLIPYGDVDLDGQVRALDASVILNYLIGQIELNELQLEAADVTLDNTVSGLDAQTILDYLTNKINSLPFVPESTLLKFDGDIFMNDVIADADETISVPIFLNSNSSISSIKSEVEFDGEVLNLTDIVWSKKYKNYFSDYSVNNGHLSFAIFGNDESINDSLCTLIFSVSEYSENTSINISRIRINENESIINAASSNVTIVTDIEDELDITFSLNQNYPNPFNPTTTIAFTIPESDHVKLEVFDALGRQINVLVNGRLAKGYHNINFDAQNLNSGLYIYRITSGKYNDTKKMILLK